MIRTTTIFRGRVQGVGFRATTARCADSFPITGFVRNNPDGSGMCVAEGRAEDIDAFLDDLGHAMRHAIESIDSTQSAASGEFPDFAVRR